MKYAKVLFENEARWGIVEDEKISFIKGLPYGY